MEGTLCTANTFARKASRGREQIACFWERQIGYRIVLNANRNKMKLSEFPCLGEVFRNVAIDVYTVFLFLPIEIIYWAEFLGN